MRTVSSIEKITRTQRFLQGIEMQQDTPSGFLQRPQSEKTIRSKIEANLQAYLCIKARIDLNPIPSVQANGSIKLLRT